MKLVNQIVYPKAQRLQVNTLFYFCKVYHFIAFGTKREKYVITLSILSIKAHKTKKYKVKSVNREQNFRTRDSAKHQLPNLIFTAQTFLFKLSLLGKGTEYLPQTQIF